MLLFDSDFVKLFKIFIIKWTNDRESTLEVYSTFSKKLLSTKYMYLQYKLDVISSLRPL